MQMDKGSMWSWLRLGLLSCGLLLLASACGQEERCSQDSDCGQGEFCNALGSCREPLIPTYLGARGMHSTRNFDSAFASWVLVRREAGLVDLERPGSPYPNHHDCDLMEVAVTQGGRMCAACERKGERPTSLCGGPAQGIPYYHSPPLQHGGNIHMLVVDLHGEPVEWFAQPSNVCVVVPLGRGRTCQACSDKDGVVESTDCGPVINTPSPDCVELSVSEEQTCTFCELGDGLVSEDCGALLELGLDTEPVDPIAWGERCSTFPTPGEGECLLCYESGITFGECVEDPLPGDCLEQGAFDYLERLDSALEELGYAPSGLDYRDLAQPVAVSFFGGNTCHGYEGFAEQDSAPIFMDNGNLRCGYLGVYIFSEICAESNPECAGDSDYDLGASVAENAWAMFSWSPDPEVYDTPDELEDIVVSSGHGECSASPLVVDPDGSGLQLCSAEEGVHFDLLGSGFAVQSGWVTRGALLALDLDLDGEIRSGAELLGEASPHIRGGLARDGFDALAQHDWLELGGNEDGRIDPSDAVYPMLLLWQDANQDGRSQAQELWPAADLGLSAIHLAVEPVEPVVTWAADNSAPLRSLVEWSDGRVDLAYDVWLRYGPLAAPAM